MDITPIEIGLTTAIVAVKDDEPRVLVAEGEKKDNPAGLPSGPFDPLAHRTLEMGLRDWVEAQTALNVAYVEQLYTFGDRGRHARVGDTDPHVVSIGYLALTRMLDNAAPLRGGRASSPGIAFFPWEDWREGRPEILDDKILPLTENLGARAARRQFARGAAAAVFRRRGHRLGRRESARALRAALRRRACGRSVARRTRCESAGAARPIHAVRSSAHSRDRHRAIARQVEIPSRGVRIDAGGIHAHRIAAHGGSDFRPALCTSRISAAWWKPPRSWNRPARCRPRPAGGPPRSTVFAGKSCASGMRRACGSACGADLSLSADRFMPIGFRPAVGIIPWKF